MTVSQLTLHTVTARPRVPAQARLSVAEWLTAIQIALVSHYYFQAD